MKESPSLTLLCWLLFSVVAAAAGAKTPLKVALLSSEHDEFTPTFRHDDVELIHHQIPRTSDPFVVRKSACKVFDEGVSALIDGTSDGGLVSQTIRSVCDSVGVPCISVGAHGKHSGDFSVRLHPTRDEVAQALTAVVKSFGWTSLTFMYDNVDNLALSEGFLNSSHIAVKFVKIDKKSDVSTILGSLNRLHPTNFLLSLTPHHLLKVLREASSAGLTGVDHKYLIASLDGDMEAVKRFSSVAESRVAVLKIADAAVFSMDDTTLQLLVDDAVSTLSTAVRNSSFGVDNAIYPQSRLCDTNSIWNEGQRYMEAIKQVQFHGKTGPVSFSTEGDRLETHFSVLQMVGGEPQTLLTYAPGEGVGLSQWARNNKKNKAKRQVPTLRVHTLFREPYVMLKNGSEDEPLTGDEEYEGYCVDILDELAEKLGFEYEISRVPDNLHGARDVNTGEWSGLIGSIVNRRADVIIGDLTVTRAREAVVDFTKPYLTFGVGLLSAKPQHGYGLDLFFFLEPFTLELWIGLLVTFLVVSVIFFLLARLSPVERSKPSREESASWVPYSCLNSAWFVVTALLRQTPIQQPRSLSIRFLAGVWWLFALIVLAVYFALLVHFVALRPAVVDEPIESIYDLVNQHRVKYGATYSGSTWSHFRNSQIPVYQRIYAGLENSRKMYDPADYKEAIDMVRESKGSYMYFLEQPSLDYITHRDCDLTNVGGIIGPMRSFAIGLQKGSPYLRRFNEGILVMRESGILDLLYNKWMRQTRGGEACEQTVDSTEDLASVLGFENFGGAFILLAIGVGVALIIAIVECCCTAGYVAKQKGDSFGGEVGSQFQQAVRGPPSIGSSVIGPASQ